MGGKRAQPVQAPSPAKAKTTAGTGPARRSGPSGVRSPGGILALQRLAGNAAVATALQRDELLLADVGSGEGGGAHDLKSNRFSPSAKLEACFDDKDRLRRNDPDTDAVRRVQQALIDTESKTGNSYDLGASGADGIYGGKTEAAVKKFKADENLGSTQFGDVGPGTMGRLDQLFAGGGGGGVVVEDEPVILDGPPGQQPGPTPPEPVSPDPLPVYDPDDPIGPSPPKPGRPPPFFSLAGLDGPPKAASDRLESRFADSGLSFGEVAAGQDRVGDSKRSALDEAIEDAVKRGIIASFEAKYKAIFAELEGRIRSVFTRLNNAVRQLVRTGVNALVNAIAFALGGPVGLGVVSIFRKVWSTISGWFGGKNDDPVEWLADRVARSVKVYIDRLQKLVLDAVAAMKHTFENLTALQAARIKGTVKQVEAFIRGEGRGAVLENVRRIYGSFSGILKDLRETLKRFGFKLSDVPGVGQVDNVVQALDAALDPSVSPDKEG